MEEFVKFEQEDKMFCVKMKNVQVKGISLFKYFKSQSYKKIIYYFKKKILQQTKAYDHLNCTRFFILILQDAI